ncbi:MAG: crossover junction endodeoxyribonuclease RuvC [Clostridia bacterium]|nr:crossover junction endodeoxyribonuclease RuvC [Clostridia bacterium]MBQ2327507.1 crossover junction endodeoxyribonuclease RuvC [Clostridia bacterium]
MRILGIDPGYGIVGYGVVEHDRGKNIYISHGAITTPAGMPFHLRLAEIYHDMGVLIEKFKPDAIAVEELFFNTNVKTAIQVGHARGVILLAIAEHNIPIAEYTPLQVKQAVVGYGRAEKKQVMEMTRVILGLKSVPRPDDAADALAIAICHGHTSNSALSK